MSKKPVSRRAKAKPDENGVASRKRIPIVGIGASAGGIEAFSRFFPAVQPGQGIAYVVILHMSPDHPSRLADTLSRFTRLPVKQVTKRTPIEADCIYVNPPDADIVISDGALECTEKGAVGPRHSIDTFLTSLAEGRGEAAACVILSGTGSDGTIGLRAIKEHDGMTLAQAGASAEYDGMMTSAIATGLVDLVLRPEEMPAKLAEYFQHIDKIADLKGPDGVRTGVADHLPQICAALRARIGHDFSNYKDKTIIRRVQRRMQVLQIDDVEEFINVLRKDPRQAELLFQDLLIGVTQFFRDPDAFKVLEREVIPKLFEGKGPNDSVRVWVPGCSTGEEAYSIAMLLRENMPKVGIAKVQIFASDVDEQALEVARVGRYPAAIVNQISPERLQRFFVREDGTYRIISDLREICLFSAHDLLRNAPFSKLDLISCRNLLIYFNGELQNRVIPLFHYALRDHGYLFLGSSENVTRHAKLFETVDKSHRIFQRRSYTTRGLPHFPLVPTEAAPRHVSDVHAPPRGPSLLDRIERTVLDRYAPAFVVIGRDGEIIHFSGQTGSYLEPATGAPDANLFRMARPGLRPTLRAALHRAIIAGRTTVQKNVAVAINGGTQKINLIIQPVASGENQAESYLVVFQNVGGLEIKGEGETVETVPDVESATMRELESELRSTRERLQATTEELEASNEELKSSNEELSSMNEELQSANEELETSKEELQSINEELHTVNSELTARVDELSRAHSDIVNLLESTQIATIFLDRTFVIKSFTPAAKDLFHLVESDTGRPLSHIRARFVGADSINDDAEKVLRTLATIERQVTSGEDGARYIMRMLPYRTIDNVISGVVVTFLNVSGIAAAEAKIEELNQSLRARLQEMEILLEVVPAGIILVEDVATQRVRINRHGALLLGQKVGSVGMRERQEGFAIRIGGRELPPEEQPLQKAIRTGQPVPFLEAELLRANGTSVDVMIAAMPLFGAQGKVHGAIAAMVDISDRKISEARQDVLLHELQHRVKNILATVSSLASRLKQTSGSVDDYAAALIGRLRAMAQTQELLSRGGEEGVRLRELISAAVTPQQTGREDVIRMSGPDITIPAELAASLSMIIYELMTNAAKYGALSSPSGNVSIAWDIVDGSRVSLKWDESGGPTVKEPTTQGFGTNFIRRSTEYELGGTAKFAFDPHGLQVRLAFPLEK